jgi:hypothetical protein
MWRIFEKFFGQQSSPEDEKRTAYKAWTRQQNSEKVLTLSRVLSGDDPEVMRLVELSIRDPAAYYQTAGKSSHFFKSEADVDPFYAAHDALEQSGYIAFIDWKSDPDELMAALNPLLARRGVQDFDWSFINELEHAEDWESLKNENLLKMVGTIVARRRFELVSLGIPWDNYDFAVIAPDELAQIDGLEGRDFSISRFG